MAVTILTVAVWSCLVVSVIMVVRAEVTRQSEEQRLRDLWHVFVFLLIARETIEVDHTGKLPTVIAMLAYLAAIFAYVVASVVRAMKFARAVMLATLAVAITLLVQRVATLLAPTG